MSCNIKFKHPFTCIISGPSSCGKSTFIMKVLQDLTLIDPKPENVYYCYAERQPMYNHLKGNIEFIEGLMNFENIDSNKRNLIIIDDLMMTIHN